MTIETLINFYQDKINNGEHKTFSENYEYKTIDILNIIQEIQEENTDLKKALNEIREYIYKNSIPLGLVQKVDEQRLDFEGDINDILQIIDKVLGGNDD